MGYGLARTVPFGSQWKVWDGVARTANGRFWIRRWGAVARSAMELSMRGKFNQRGSRDEGWGVGWWCMGVRGDVL